MVTIGIKPTEPATGYGYIRVGQVLPRAAWGETVQDHFFQSGTVRGETAF